jgi:tetratricopeptide (TPR) repeat protein
MNLGFNEKTWLVLRLCLSLATCLHLADARSQVTVQDDLLAPPRPNLVPVHWPRLSELEAEVREQLSAAQKSLTALATNPATSNQSLSEAYGTTGEIYHAYSLASPARECYLNAAALAPKDFRWIYFLAKIDQQEGRTDEAMRRFRAARVLRPDYVAAAVNLGNIHLELNQLRDAEVNFQAALTLDSGNPAAAYGLGQVALSKRNYAEAANYFERALARLPDANRIHYSLFLAYRSLGQAEKAKAHLAQQGTVGVRVADPLVDALQDLIKGERLHLVRGKQALGAKRYAEAADEFRKAIAGKPDSVAAHLNLGTVLALTEDGKGAAAEFEEVLRLAPNNMTAHYNLAVLAASSNDHARAIAHLQSILSVDQNDLGARFLLAQELGKAGRVEAALSEFSRVVEADPNNEEALLEEVKLLLRLQRYKQALDSLEKANARYPQRGQTAATLAYLLAASPQLDLRNGQKALELAQMVYQASGSVNHGALVALALAELGRCDEAAALTRSLIAKTLKEQNPDLAEKLKAELGRYEKERPCRATTETLIPN